MHRPKLGAKPVQAPGMVVAEGGPMLRVASALPLLFATLVGCSGEDSNGSDPRTGGSSSGGTSSGGGGNTTSGGTAGSASGGSGGVSTGGSGGGIQPGNDIENLDGKTVTAFPAHIGFATNAYEDVHEVVWASEGATHSYAPGAGWNGGGAAHFTPPYLNEGYSGLGQFHFAPGLSTAHLSMRWLMKVGPTMGELGYGNKTLIFVRNPNDDQHHRPMIITRDDPAHPGAFVPGACDGTVCQYKVGPNSEPFFPDGSDTFWLSPSGYAEQWVSWEFEVDADAGWIRLYVTTQDGLFNDTLYVDNAMVDSMTGGTFEYIDILGGYFAAATEGPGNWFELDEIVIHDQHIGPPPGFVQ